MSEGESPIFYRVDDHGMSMREYSWGSKNPLVLLFCAIRKYCKLGVGGGSTDDPAVESLQPFEVASLPEDIREKFEPLAYELTALGFVEPVYHAISDPLNFTTHYWATFRHVSGNAFGRVHMRTWTKTHPPRVGLFPVFVSAFSDGTFLFSSAGKPDVESPPGTIELRKQGMATAALWQEHEKTLQTAGKTIYQLMDEGSLRWATGAYHTATRDFHLKRGAFKKLTEQDQKEATILEEAKRSGSANADVLAEIEILRKAPQTWKSSLWLLVITGVAFFLAGGLQNSFEIALMLIPILLVHEAGHYLAMHVFKYRNLRMFFIPLLGAAVTGQSYNVAAWKKVLVSLMGPLPGIILGAALAIAGMRRGSEWAVKAGELSVIINGFNLLPLLPLDGGHVVQNILFSRHYILDTVFRAVTAVGILLLGFAISSNGLVVVGVFSIMALGASFKMARVTEKVREMKLPMLAEDGESIPPATADQIVTQLKEKFPKGVTTKTLAQQTLTIFETLNQRPPGWLATVFFMFLHAGAFVGACVMLLFITVNKNGALGRYDRPARVPLNVAEIKAWPGGEPKAATPGQNVEVVAVFRKRPAAEKAFNETTPVLPSGVEGLLFGNAVFVRVPATNQDLRTQLYNRLLRQTTNVFVARTNYAAQLKFAFTLPASAQKEKWFEELHLFFQQNSGRKLIPPWTAPALWAERERAEATKARRTLQLLTAYDEEAEAENAKEPKRDYVSERRAMTAALRAGDDEKVKALTLRRKNEEEDREKKRRDRVAKLPEAEVHRVALETHMNYPSDTNALPAYRASQARIQELMGTVHNAKPELARYELTQGYLIAKDDLVRMQGMQFADTMFAAPVFARWLEEHGAKDLRYGIEGTEVFAYDGEEEEP